MQSDSIIDKDLIMPLSSHTSACCDHGRNILQCICSQIGSKASPLLSAASDSLLGILHELPLPTQPFPAGSGVLASICDDVETSSVPPQCLHTRRASWPPRSQAPRCGEFTPSRRRMAALGLNPVREAMLLRPDGAAWEKLWALDPGKVICPGPEPLVRSRPRWTQLKPPASTLSLLH